MASSERRIWIASTLLWREVVRRRFSLALIFIVPLLFDAVVLVTTAPENVKVTIASLREDGAAPPTTKRTFLDLDLFDDGARQVDQRQLSLVFLGHAAVCFLACFLAFNLVHRRRDADARLVLAGYRPAEVLLSKLVVLLLLVALLAIDQTVLLRPWLRPLHPWVLALGLFAGGLAYGAIGLLIGAVVKQELEGIFLIVLFTNVDPGWLQNPLYFAHTQRPEIIESLPGFASTQLALLGAFFDALPLRLVAQAAASFALVLLLAFAIFWVRIRPARPARSAASRTRLHFGKVLVVAYVIWFATFELVGRHAATLHTHDLTSAWDRAIPLLPVFVWAYELCYLLPLLALWLFRDWHRFNIGLLAIGFASACAIAVYLLVPVAFPRPELGSSLAERILGAEYAADFSPGANKLPSLHVAIAWIMLCAIWGESRSRLVDALAAVVVLAVTVSTLFVKQHLILDVATAIPLGLLSYAAAALVYRRVVDPRLSPEQVIPRLAFLLSWSNWRRRAESSVPS